LLRHKAKPPAVLFDILTALELEQQNVDESLLKRSSEWPFHMLQHVCVLKELFYWEEQYVLLTNTIERHIGSQFESQGYMWMLDVSERGCILLADLESVVVSE